MASNKNPAATNSSCEALNEHVDFVAGSVAACLSIVPNLLLLLTFSLARKRDKASPMGVVHFSFLAVLDISYGVLDTISDFPFKKVLRLEFIYRYINETEYGPTTRPSLGTGDPGAGWESLGWKTPGWETPGWETLGWEFQLRGGCPNVGVSVGGCPRGKESGAIQCF